MQRINIQEVFKSVVKDLMRTFEDTEQVFSKPTDRGEKREEAIRSFLRSKLPRRYGVSKGYVVSSKGVQSRQCDVIIYDAGSSPIFYSAPNHEVFPVESVYGVIEVKSKLGKPELADAIENIKSFKQVPRKELTDVPLGKRSGISLTYNGPINVKIGGLVAYSLGDGFANKTDGQIRDEIVGKIAAEDLVYRIDFVCIVDMGIILPLRHNKDDNSHWISLSDENAKMTLVGDPDQSVGMFFIALLAALNNTQLEQPDLFDYFNQR